MNLYVIRHGQTNLNKEKKYNCRIDEDINKVGIEQAEDIRQKIENLDIDLIICSPMRRTKHTSEIINSKSIPTIYDDRLMERVGGKLTGEELGEFYYTDFWNYYSKEKVEGLESIEDLFKRVEDFINETSKKYNDKNILIVTHGGIDIAIYFYFNELPNDGMLYNWMSKNCEIKNYKI